MSDAKRDWLTWNLKRQTAQALDVIESHVKNVWKGEPGIMWYTPHDASHAQHVAEAVQMLIPSDAELSDPERFSILAAAWLHDIGMIPAEDENPDHVRRDHHERSRDYIQKNYGGKVDLSRSASSC